MKTPAQNPILDLLARILLWTHSNDRRWPRYILIALGILLIIWGPALAYLMLTPAQYTSKWTLILPGSGSNAMVNVADIGQASLSATSPFGNSSLSPQVNYKEILRSQVVIERVAKDMKLSPTKISKPRVKLIDQTSLLLVSIQADSSELAIRKSWLFYNALQAQLNQLRLDEVGRREAGVNQFLKSYSTKLKRTRRDLLEYQSQSKIVSISQLDEQLLNLERKKQAVQSAETQLAQTSGRVLGLSSVLGVSARQASEALILQTDPHLKKLLNDHVEASVLLERYSAKWGRNHPSRKSQNKRLLLVKKAIDKQVIDLIGRKSPKLLKLLSLESDLTRGALFEELISLEAQRQGWQNKVKSLNTQLVEGMEQLNSSVKAAAKLDDFEREHQISEAVFTSALARIDTGKSDLFASYPLVQLLVEPDLPASPSSPRRGIAIAGASLATLFTITGLFMLWLRKPWILKLRNERLPEASTLLRKPKRHSRTRGRHGR